MGMLFHVLWVVTFILHMLFVSAALGGSVLAAVAEAKPRKLRAAAALFTDVNTWAIPLAITFGIPPLLFMQLLDGRLFAAAAPHVAAGWLAMLVLLGAAYYGHYLVKARLRREDGGGVSVLLTLEALLFLAITAVQVSVHLLGIQPGLWEPGSGSGWVVLRDPTFLPRFLHFVLAGISLSAALAMRQGIKRADDALARFGARAALWATLIQIVDGFWLVMALPRPVLRGLMRGGAATMVPLTVSILLGLVLLVLLFQLPDPLAAPRKARHVTELILGAIVLMVVTRHQVRGLYSAISGAGNQVDVQPGMLAALLVAFLAGLGLILYAANRARRDRPKNPEAKA